jgi:hypothetical protein
VDGGALRMCRGARGAAWFAMCDVRRPSCRRGSFVRVQWTRCLLWRKRRGRGGFTACRVTVVWLLCWRAGVHALEVHGDLKRGTKIICTLKEDQSEFLEERRLKDLVRMGTVFGGCQCRVGRSELAIRSAGSGWSRRGVLRTAGLTERESELT